MEIKEVVHKCLLVSGFRLSAGLPIFFFKCSNFGQHLQGTEPSLVGGRCGCTPSHPGSNPLQPGHLGAYFFDR